MDIEQTYMRRLAQQQYPGDVDAMAQGEQQGLEQAAMQATVGTLPQPAMPEDGQGSIREIPRNVFQQALGKFGEALTAAGVQLDKVGIDIPALGRVTLKDLTIGESGKVVEDISYGFMPTRGAGGIGGTAGLKPEALELLNLPVVASAAKVAGKGAIAAGKTVTSQMPGKSKSVGNIAIDFKPDTKFLSASSDAGMVGGHVRENSLRITYAEVEEKSRGQGKGIELYQSLIDNALSKGLTVTSDVTVEAPAVRVYEALKKRGYNVQKTEGGVLEDGTVYGKSASSPAFTITAGPNSGVPIK